MHLFSSKIAREITTNKHVALNAGRTYFYIWPSYFSCGYPCLLTPCQQNLYLNVSFIHFYMFSLPFPFIFNRKDIKIPKRDFDQQKACKAPVCWLKYTTDGWSIWMQNLNLDKTFLFKWYSKTITLDSQTAFCQSKTESAWYLDPLRFHIL